MKKVGIFLLIALVTIFSFLILSETVNARGPYGEGCDQYGYGCGPEDECGYGTGYGCEPIIEKVALETNKVWLEESSNGLINVEKYEETIELYMTYGES